MNRREWVDVRRQTVSTMYTLPAAEQQRADAFFAKTEALAATCADQAAFEQQMETSGLNKEYNDLLASFGKYVKMPDGGKVPTTADAIGQIAANAPRAMAESHARSIARREVNSVIEKTTGINLYSGVSGALLDVPILGSIIGWMNTFSWFRKVFGRRKSPEELQQQ